MGRRLLFRQPPAASLLMLFFGCLALYQMHLANVRGIPKKGIVGTLLSDTSKVDITIMPKEYDELSSQTQLCQDRFGRNYLKAFQSTKTAYCEKGSFSELSCFSNSIDAEQKRVDSFCIGGPSTFIPKEKYFRLWCDTRDFLNEGSKWTPPIYLFPQYWYETGPKYIFHNYFNIEQGEDEPVTDPSVDTTAVLIKREDVRQNLWHGLMEIMSTYLTLDVLRLTKDTNSSAPYFSADDFNKTQIVILDDLPDGPYIDAWKLFATKPILRLANLTSSKHPVLYKNIITPLPGASNPFWQGDWELLNCHSSPILRAFTARILTAYDIPIKKPHVRDPKSDPEHKETGVPPLRLTFIHRTQKRRLINSERMLPLLRKRYDSSVLNVQSIDYATLPFEGQLKHTHHDTDILLGVHGAGLTHGMFLRPGSAIIELMPFDLDYKGFRNMVDNLEGVKYHRGELEDRPDKTKAKGNWQDDDVWMDEEKFMTLVTGVIDEMAKKKGLL